MKRKRFYILFCLILSLTLGGCGARTVEDMYSIPKRSPEYKNLQIAIDSSMDGLEYAAPVSGENRQSVQTADLDGDGVDEYLVFAKGATENPLRILIFRLLQDEHFELMESITCKGATFEQVQYVEFDNKPGRELVVGRQINDQVTRIASVYSFAGGQSEQILSMIYCKYVTCDLNQDGCSELMVIRNGEAESSNAVAVLYSYGEDTVERSMEVSLSEQQDQIRRITLNRLESGETAVYIASAHNDEAVITDVFALREGMFVNVTRASEFGTGVQTLRNYYVYAEDIDGDGILELPSLVPMRYSSTDPDIAGQHLIRWYSIDAEGTQIDKRYTYHDFSAGWYLELGNNWINRITTQQNGSAYTFYMWNENYGEALAVFTIFAYTGKDRDSQAAIQNRFALYRGESVVYAAKLEAASAIYGITEEYLVNSFHLIHQDWKPGET